MKYPFTIAIIFNVLAIMFWAFIDSISLADEFIKAVQQFYNNPPAFTIYVILLTLALGCENFSNKKN